MVSRGREAAVLARKKRADFDARAAESMSSAEIAAFLDERERRFAKEFNSSLNGTRSAIAAGYKPGKNNASAAVQASRLLRDERVRAYRVALIRESVEDRALTRDSLVLRLLEIIDRCMQKEPVMEWDASAREWVESGEWQFDAKGATRALQQLSKMLGFDAPVKHDLGGDGFEAFLRRIGEGRTY